MDRHYGLAGRVGWRSGWSLRWAGTAALGLAGLLGCSGVARAQEPAPDNSKTNQRDRDKAAATADRQKMSPEDRELTRKIRAAITSDKSLSTYAHNIKILAQDGRVTLKGPVRSDEERAAILNKAMGIAGEGNVADQMGVAPLKS
jgi:hyperosmotically inducible periplasmic protein